MRDEAYKAIRILKDIRHISRRISEICDRIDACRAMGERTTASLNAIRVQSEVNSKVEMAVVSISDLEKQLNEILDALVSKRGKAQQAIHDMDAGEDEKRLLEMRYFDRRTWKFICWEMHLSRSTSFRLHESALIHFYQEYKKPGA